MIRRCVATLLLLCSAGVASAADASGAPPPMYVGLGTNGEVRVSAVPFEGARSLQLDDSAWLDAPLRQPRKASGPVASAIDDAVARAAQLHDVEAELLHAVIKAESGYRHRVVSRAGAAGLMQLMPATAKRFGVSDRFDIEQNVAGGAAYLKWLLTRFSGDLDLVLAAYNAGEGSVQKYGNQIPPYRETRAYVAKVRDYYLAARN